MKNIAVLAGFWSTNIGNAFFNIGGKWLLEQIFSGDRVQFIQDQPGYWTFWNQAKGNPLHDFLLLKHLKCDCIVLQGPLFTENFPNLWRETFLTLKSRGTRIILLGAAMFRFNETEKETTLRELDLIQLSIKRINKNEKHRRPIRFLEYKHRERLF